MTRINRARVFLSSIAVISGLTLASSPSTLATELITNGDFGTGDFTNWVNTGNSPDNKVVATHTTTLPGNMYVALIGDGNGAGSRSIYQEFEAPTFDHWLTVRFDYGFAGLTSTDPNIKDVLESFVQIDGFGSVSLLSTSSGSGTFSLMDSVTMMFGVSGASAMLPNARITFLLNENANDFSGDSVVGIDNVSVIASIHPIQEPGTLALLGLGLAGLGAIRRRRRT